MGKANTKEKKKSQKEINRENIHAGLALIVNHPLFGHISCPKYIRDKKTMGVTAYATVDSDGSINLNEDLTLAPKQWAYVIAHWVLHLCFGHFDEDKVPGFIVTDFEGNKTKKTEFDPLLWNMACDIFVDKFLEDVKF